MNHMVRIMFFTLFLIFSLKGQQKDTGTIKDGVNEFWDTIESSLGDFNKADNQAEKIFQVDLKNFSLPESPELFTKAWHNPPVSQGRTNTCWSYSTTSFFESEVYRLNKKKIKLSPLWTAYWEFIEKAKMYVETRGESYFGEGSEANAVTRIWKQYGVVPEEAYTGLLPSQPFPDHEKMFEEMTNYLTSVKENDAWNENEVIETITFILNKYMTAPPEKFSYESRNYTPFSFLEEVVNLNLDDYVDVVNYLQQPFWEQVEYEVPDNWWHNKDYYNVPLSNFMSIIKNAVRKGYTLSIGGDVSEGGKVPEKDVFVVPSFDIPSEYINDYSKQFRFSNETTTDDHGIHLVGFAVVDGVEWYLIKDSGSSSRNGRFEGYYFFHEDYVKLKMMDFMVHKDAVENWLKK